MSLDAPVAAALGRIQNPRLGNDLLSAGMIRDLTVSADGRVAFTFLLSRQDPATLVREARKALQEIDGVTDVKIKVVDPAGPAPVTHGPPGAPRDRSPRPPPPRRITVDMPGLGRVIAISSGKGGVGKSTVAVNLASRWRATGIASA